MLWYKIIIQGYWVPENVSVKIFNRSSHCIEAIKLLKTYMNSAWSLLEIGLVTFFNFVLKIPQIWSEFFEKYHWIKPKKWSQVDALNSNRFSEVLSHQYDNDRGLVEVKLVVFDGKIVRILDSSRFSVLTDFYVCLREWPTSTNWVGAMTSGCKTTTPTLIFVCHTHTTTTRNREKPKSAFLKLYWVRSVPNHSRLTWFIVNSQRHYLC